MQVVAFHTPIIFFGKSMYGEFNREITVPSSVAIVGVNVLPTVPTE